VKMKCAVVSTFISLAFASQTFAVLRPLFPVKPAAPFNGELIVIGDDLVLRSTKKPLPQTQTCLMRAETDLDGNLYRAYVGYST
jgi:hypothetical protein